MRAYKFLGQGAVGTFTGFAWPTPVGDAPGAWIGVEGPLDPCRNGVHVCRSAELAHWLHEELWELEVAGEQLEGVDCLLVQRARLVRRVAGWDSAGASRFATACIEHAHGIVGDAAVLEDARHSAREGYPAIAAFAAAAAVARKADDAEAAFANERAWQSAWIEHELL